MITGAESLGCYQSAGQAYFSDNSPNQLAPSSGSLSVRHAGRDIRVSEEVNVNSSQTKEGGCRSKEGVKVKSFEGGGVRALEDPFNDYERVLKCGKQELLARMSFDRKGMIQLKRYVDRVDNMDDKGGARIEDNKDESVLMFCNEVREGALAIFQDFMSQFKFERAAENGVLYLLKRLHRYDELEAHCRKLLSQSKRKEVNLEHIELALVEALVGLGRVNEARKQLDITRNHYGEGYSVINADCNVFLAEDNSQGACDLLDRAFNDKKIWPFMYRKQKKYVERYCHESKSGAALEAKRDTSVIPLKNPEKDYGRGLAIGKKSLMERMSDGEKGIKEFKEYVDALDDLDRNGRGLSISGDRVRPRIILFCLAIRERSLLIFEDYLKRNPKCSVASNGKLFVLKRLGRDQALLAYCDQILSRVSLPHVVFKRIEALTALGRFSEALEQIKKSRICINNNHKMQLEVAAIQINMAHGEWEYSKMRLEKLLKKSNQEECQKNYAAIRWLLHCCKNPDKFIIDIRCLRNYSLSMSISPEKGFREWSFKDDELSDITIDSPNPQRDFHAGLMVTKGYLRLLMLNWDDHGLVELKKYFVCLDQAMDEKQGGGLSKLNPEAMEKARCFCLKARQNGLALIEDFLRENPKSERGIWAKLFFLDRLAMYTGILEWFESFYPISESREVRVELKVIESLSELGRYEEARKQIGETCEHFGRVGRDEIIKSIYKLNVMAGKFENAKWNLVELKFKGLIDDGQYNSRFAWVDFKINEQKKVSGTISGTKLSDDVLSDKNPMEAEELSKQLLPDDSPDQIYFDNSGLRRSEYTHIATDYRVRCQSVNQAADSFDNVLMNVQSIKESVPDPVSQPECSLMGYGLVDWESERLTSARNYYRTAEYTKALSTLYEIKDGHAGQGDLEVDGLFSECIKKIWGSDGFGKQA